MNIEELRKKPIVQEMEKAMTDEEAQAIGTIAYMMTVRAANMAYDQKISEDILIAFQKGQEPAFVAATLTNMILRRVEDQAVEEGLEPYPKPAVAVAGGFILEMIIKMAQQAGVAEFGDEEKENAYYAAVDLYMAEDEANGELDLTGAEELGIPVPETLRHGIPRSDKLKQMRANKGGQQGRQMPQQGMPQQGGAPQQSQPAPLLAQNPKRTM